MLFFTVSFNSALQHCCLLNILFWQVYPVDEKSFRSRLALLIVNRDFDDPDMTRYGAEKDEQNMEHLLKELGYKVFKYTNLSGQVIFNKGGKNLFLKDSSS